MGLNIFKSRRAKLKAMIGFILEEKKLTQTEIDYLMLAIDDYEKDNLNTIEKLKKEKFYERTEVVMGKCLLHKETDASKVDPEVRAFVGMRSVFYFVIFLKAIMTDTIQIDR
jgi:hypothetical protein